MRTTNTGSADFTLGDMTLRDEMLPRTSTGGSGSGRGHTAVAAPPDDDPVGRILEDIKRLSVHDLRRLAREVDRLLRT